MGIRSDDEAVLHDLRSLYSDRLVDDDRGDDYSISMTPAGDGPSRPLPCLSHGRRALLRSRSSTRLIRSLDVVLADLEPSSLHGLPTLAGFSLVTKNNGAALVPSSVASTSVERVVAAQGLRLADEVAVRLEVGSLEAVVVPGLSGRSDHPVLQDELTTPVERYKIRTVVWTENEADLGDRPALGLIRLIPRLTDRSGLDASAYLDRMTCLATQAHSARVKTSGANLSAILASVDW